MKSRKGEAADRRGEDADRTDRTDIPDPVDHTGSEWENGPGVDVDDPNLSQVMAEAGAEDRRDELGNLDDANDSETLRLDDPEAEEDGDEHGDENEEREEGGRSGDDDGNGAGRRP